MPLLKLKLPQLTQKKRVSTFIHVNKHRRVFCETGWSASGIPNRLGAGHGDLVQSLQIFAPGLLQQPVICGSWPGGRPHQELLWVSENQGHEHDDDDDDDDDDGEEEEEGHEAWSMNHKSETWSVKLKHDAWSMMKFGVYVIFQTSALRKLMILWLSVCCVLIISIIHPTFFLDGSNNSNDIRDNNQTNNDINDNGIQHG